MNNRPKRAVVITLIIIAIFGLLIGLLNIKSMATLSIPEIYPVSVNFASVAPYDNSNLVYSNGDALMLYNYSTGMVNQLSPSVGLAADGIDSISVSANNQLVLFHDQQVVQGGVLYQQLISKGLSTQSGYWWLYSVSSRSFSTLTGTVIMAKLTNHSIVALSSTGGSEQLISYTSSLVAQNTINITGVFNFFILSHGYLLETPDNSILLTSNGTISQLLVKDANIVAVTPNSQQAVIVTGSGSDSHQLAILNINKDSVKTVARNITNQPVWSNSGNVLYASTSMNHNSATTNLYTYNLSNNKIDLWRLTGPHALITNNIIVPTALITSQIAVVSSSSTSYYLIGHKDLASPSNLLR